MAHHQTKKTVRWVDDHRLHVIHEPADSENDHSDAASWSSASDSGPTATTTVGGSTPRPADNKSYAAPQGASGSGSGAYRQPAAVEGPKKPRLHAYLEEFPLPLDVRARTVQPDSGVGEDVLAGYAFFDTDPHTMTLRFYALDGVTWSRTIVRRSHGKNGRLGSFISVRDVLTAIWLEVRDAPHEPLYPFDPLYEHARKAMDVRQDKTMRKMDLFEMFHGHLYFTGIEPQPGAAGWEFVVRLAPRFVPA